MLWFRLSAGVAALALCSTLSATSSEPQSAAKPALAAAPSMAAAPAASAAISVPSGSTGKVIADIWVIKSQPKYVPAWLPIPEPVLTAESVQQLRAIPCVSEFAARREIGSLVLRAKDDKSLDVALWVFDTPTISARGWQLNSQAAAPNSYYLTADLASRLGLPAKATQGQTVEPLSFTPSTTSRVVQSMTPASPEQIKSQIAASATRIPAAPYGGTFDADIKLLSQRPTQLVLQFAPLFRSQHDKWTDEQRSAQQSGNGPVMYARTKPGLNAATREACRAQLEAHTKIWAVGLPRTTWEVVPLMD
jgi:hypothetical protein